MAKTCAPISAMKAGVDKMHVAFLSKHDNAVNGPSSKEAVLAILGPPDFVGEGCIRRSRLSALPVNPTVLHARASGSDAAPA
jgi:hypothetical protein